MSDSYNKLHFHFSYQLKEFDSFFVIIRCRSCYPIYSAGFPCLCLFTPLCYVCICFLTSETFVHRQFAKHVCFSSQLMSLAHCLHISYDRGTCRQPKVLYTFLYECLLIDITHQFRHTWQ